MSPTRLFSAASRKVDKNLLTPLKLQRLVTSTDPQLAGIGRALISLIGKQHHAAEQRWFQSIERIRAETEASQEVVEVPDYGAGSPQDTRSQEEMKSGRVCTEVVGKACRLYSKEPFWAELLFHIIRQLQPSSCIEMGACMGISGAYQAAALELNGAGHLRSMEGAAAFAAVASQNWGKLGLAQRVSVTIGPFHETLGGVLDEAGPVDCCFIDGHHDEAATVGYFERVAPFLSANAVLLFDDIRWSSGMERAWRKIQADERIGFAIDLGKVGICLTGTRQKGSIRLTIE